MRTRGNHAAIMMFVLTPILVAAAASQTPEGPPPIRLPVHSVKADATVEAGGERHLAAAPDGVWLTSRATGTVALIDAGTGKPGTPIAVGKGPCRGVVVAFKSVWMPLCGQPGLARVDVSGNAPKVVVMLTGQSGAGPLTTGTGSIWMITDPSGTLARIDPDTNAVVAEVMVPAGASAIAFGQNAVWITSSTAGVVTRVNGHTNVVTETIAVGRTPSAVAVGEGGVWTWNGGDGSVSRIDPATNKVVATIKIGVTAASGAIAVGEGSVWVSAPGAPIIRIDPATNRLVQQFSGAGGGALAIGHHSLWIAATPTAIWRVDPKRVEATLR